MARTLDTRVRQLGGAHLRSSPAGGASRAPAGGASRAPAGGASRAQAAGYQRARLFAAVAAIVAEGGLRTATVARIVSRANVSRKTFYALFYDRDDCIRAAFEDAVARVRPSVLHAYRSQPRWIDAVREGLLALLSFFDAEPHVARLCVFEAYAASEATRDVRRELLDVLIAAVDAGRREKRAAPAPVTAEGLVGGTLSILHARLAADGGAPLIELLNPLMAMLATPYLGFARAQRELRRYVPRPPVASAPATASPVRDSSPQWRPPVRLTYRTLRTLAVIGERPGSSNREVAEGSGIVDQGQVSRLLRRLCEQSLVENSGLGQAAGAQNAWSLTPTGSQILAEVRGDFVIGAALDG